MNADDVALEALKFKIHRDRGFNSHIYKDKCIRRRLAVRMLARGCDDFLAYSDLLDSDPVEYDRLIETLTINVTKFFRNPQMWEVLAGEVLPGLLENQEEEISVWSAGCATGEEPYSVSILLREQVAAQGGVDALERVSICGTDIDSRCLEAARVGTYSELSFGDTPAALRARWFSDAPPFRLRDEARDRVTFRYADLISDDAPARQSLILCRNVLIYFDRPSQEHLFHKFYDALLPGGVLVLGRVETLLGQPRSLFRPVSQRERIYMKPRH